MESKQAAASWAELLGSNNWENLLDPIDLNLRKLILRCGDLCQVTYDTFINEQYSKYCGCSRYGKKTLLNKVCFPEASDYEIASFLYATARVSVPEAFLLKSQSREKWDRESNWIGYIAVSTDEASQRLGRREIYVAWRGTTRNYEWINILGAKLQSAEPLLHESDKKFKTNNYDNGGDGSSSSSDEEEEEDDDDDNKIKIMQGWLTIYISDDPKSPFTKASARIQLLTKIRSLIEEYKDEEISITFTGHSLGATLSVVAAFDVVENITKDTEIPVTAFVFGCPKVGNKKFNDRFNSYPKLKVLHIKNVIDLLVHYPGRLLGYVSTGIPLEIDTRKSPYLKDSKDPGDWHNLQAMLHVVNGWNGKDGEFEAKVKRSIALVNKSCEFLKDECLVPGSWWIQKNKGMVLNDGGEWVFGEPEEEDLPVPEL